MACNSCGNKSGFNGSCNSCSKVPDIDTETALETIKNGDENFCFNEVTDEICDNLQNDKGIHPFNGKNNTDCKDLHALNTYLNGNLWNSLKTLDFCDINALKCWLYNLVSNSWNVTKALVCAICGLWKKIHELEDILIKNGYVTVTKVYSYTVPKSHFVNTGNPKTDIWWSGSIGVGEEFITIPVNDMDIVDTVMAQPQVVGGRVHAATVAIQTAEKQGSNYIVNFDTYEIKGSYEDGENFPYELPIKFVVVGRKKV